MNKPYFERMALVVQDEIRRTSKAIARSLPYAENTTDAKSVSEEEIIQHIRLNADGPGFLQQVLDRMAPADPSGLRPENGVKYYLNLIKEARPDLYTQATGQPLARDLNDYGGLSQDLEAVIQQEAV